MRKIEDLFVKHEKKIEIGYGIFCAFVFFLWSIKSGAFTAPDETMRYQIPEYIYRYGALPNGDMEELRNELWGFSYAYYPNMLGPIMSAAFMKIASIFSTEKYVLLMAARITSILFGVVSVMFLMMSCKRLFSRKTKWVITVFVSMIPQFVYLSTYVNNDIICIGGSAIICYSWICGLQDGWNYKNSCILTSGIVVCSLSYYNSYGWILCSIFLFGFSFVLQRNDSGKYKKMLKYGLFISCLTLLVISGFFIRNAILYDGDFLGMNSLTQSSELYAVDWLKPSKRNIAVNIGMSVREMLHSTQWGKHAWLESTYKSFIGGFGYMEFFLSDTMYNIYKFVIILLLAGWIGQVIQWMLKQEKTTLRNQRYLSLFYVNLLIAFCIPICLSIYYSYAVDYQAQGRYCYPMIISLGILLASGYEWYIVKLKDIYAKAISIFMVAGEIGMMVYAYLFYYVTVINKG